MHTKTSMHRMVIIAVYTMILVAMLTIFIAADSFGNANTFLLITILLVPTAAIAMSLMPLSSRARITGYLVIAMASIPIAFLGLPGGWGLLFSIGIVFLVWGAWFERWGHFRDEPG